MPDYQKLPFPYGVGGGLDVKSPADQTPPGSYRRFTNVESQLIDGAPCSRRPAVSVEVGSPPAAINYGAAVHTIEHLIDEAQGEDIFFLGVGISIVIATTGGILDAGYSGNPLSVVEYREAGNSIAWALIGDANKNSKVGIGPPNTNTQLVTRPTAFTNPDSGLGGSAFTNPSYAIDGLPGTYASAQAATSTSYSCNWNSWLGFGGTPTAFVLSVLGGSATFNASGSSAELQYSLDGGSTWTTIWNNPRQGITFLATVSLPTSQNLAMVQVRTQAANSSGVAHQTVFIYDIFITSYFNAGAALGLAVYKLGISPPGAVPPFVGSGAPVVVGSAHTGNLNSSTGVGYDWRATYYSVATQAESNPSAIEASLTSLTNQSQDLTPGAYSGDPQVSAIRYWRRGGTLGDTWRLVGQQANSALTVTAASWTGGIATLTLNVDSQMLVGQYVTVTGITPSGFNGNTLQLTAVGAAGTKTISYAISNPGSSYVSGGTVVFNDNSSDASIAAGVVLSLTNDVPVTSINQNNQTVYQQPLQFIWGPYQGNVIFGCGDVNRPGFLYWSNPGNPDGWSSLNNVEVTAPSDGLQNGFIWRGSPWVFSLDKPWQIFPLTIGTITGYEAFDVGGGHGLASPWAFYAGPQSPAIWYLTRAAGVVQFNGGGPSVSITEDKLWPLFGIQTAPATGIENLWPIMIPGPDIPTKGAYRVIFHDNEVRLSYYDTNPGGSQPQVLIYNIYQKRWRHAQYPWHVACFYAAIEGEDATLQMGGADGGWYEEQQSYGGYDQSLGSNVAFQSLLRPGYIWQPDYQAWKEYGNVVVDLQTNLANVTFTALFNDNNATVTSVTATLQNGSVRGQIPVPLLTSGGHQTYARDVAIDLTWQSNLLVTVWGLEILQRLDIVPIDSYVNSFSAYGIENYFHVTPESYLTLRSTAAVTLTILLDNGTTMTITLPSTANVKEKLYLNSVVPNKGLLVRVQLSSTAPFRLYGKESFLALQPWGGIQPVLADAFSV